MRVEQILKTSKLTERSRRLPSFKNEIETVYNLGQVLKNSPFNLVDALLQAAMDLCRAGTAGISILETTPEGAEIFHWTNLSGKLAKCVGNRTPRNFSLCGVCLDRNAPQLFAWPARYFQYLQNTMDVPIVEALVVPIYTVDLSPGTIWIFSHDEDVHFDSDDARIMTRLAEFTGSALGLIHALHC